MNSSTTTDSKSSPGSDRGSGFSMKTFMLTVVFGIFSVSPISAGMIPCMGMDPMMGGGMGGGMGMDPMMGGGMGMDPMMGGGMGMPGYHWKHGRRRGIFGLRRSRGHFVPNNPYGMMGMGGMGGMSHMGMGMDPMMGGMPGMGMPGMGMGMDPMMGGMPGMGMPGMGMGGMPGCHWKHGRRRGLFGLRRSRGRFVPNNPYGMGMGGMPPMGMGGMPPMGLGGMPPMGLGGPMF